MSPRELSEDEVLFLLACNVALYKCYSALEEIRARDYQDNEKLAMAVCSIQRAGVNLMEFALENCQGAHQ